MDNNWNDSIGANNGTPINTPVFSMNSKIGSYAGNLNGTDQYINFGSNLFNTHTEGTITAWVYLNSNIVSATHFTFNYPQN